MRSLQCARAIAALLVVYFHSVIQIRELSIDDTGPFALLGQSGVDVFFVLSGLLMWRSTHHGPYPTLLFYKKRFARIAPLYWIMTLAATLVAVAVPSMLQSTRFAPDHALASLAFIPWPNPAAQGRSGVLMTPVIVPGWTLNFEVMFYAIFGIALIGPRKHRLGRVLAFFGLFMLGVALVGPRLLILKFYDPFLVAEFLLGIMIGVMLESSRRLPPRAAAVLLAIAIVTLLVLDADPFPVSRFFCLGLPAAVAIYCLATLELSGVWPQAPWLSRLGDASFSIYLTHIFVLAGLRVLWTWVLRHTDLGFSSPAFLVCAMTLSCLTGLLVYRLIERPLGGMMNRALGLQH